MLKGFDEETSPLTDYEREKLVPVVALGLRYHKGKNNAVTSTHICRALKEKGFRITPAILRKVVNHIRLNNIVSNVIASSNGYWVSDSRAEVMAHIESLDGRARAILAVGDALREQIDDLPIFYKN